MTRQESVTDLGIRQNCFRTLAVVAGVTVALVMSLLISAKSAVAASPETDGKIAFTSWRDGNAEIYSMNPDGSEQTNLTNNAAGDYDPSFSPDGEKIAFTSYRDGNPEIYSMDSNGENQTRLTDNGPSSPYPPEYGCDPAYDGRPTFSPDGEKIAFEGCQDQGLKIYVIDADGSEPIRLTDTPISFAFSESTPAFSPDGKKIVFTNDCCTNAEIWMVNVDGSKLRRLTENSRFDSFPTFSPDGKKIAWTSDEDIYVMKANGSKKTRLTTDAYSSDPSFSPDGKAITFTSYRDGNNEVYAMRANGTGNIRLTYDTASDFATTWGLT